MHWSYSILHHHSFFFLFNKQPSLLFSILFLFLFLFITITVFTPPQVAYSLYFGDTINIIESNKSFLLSSPQIAATEGGNVYVVWVDKNILYFKSSSDYGSKFNTSIILSKNGNLTSSPQLAATEGGNVYVVWVDKNILYFKSSSDYGSKFNTSIILSKNGNLTSSPQLAATEGGNVYVVWVDKNILYFKSSSDYGSKFNTSIILSKNGNLTSSPQLAATEGGNVYVVWVDKNILYFKSSSDYGSKFNTSIILSKNGNLTSSPQLAATEGGNVYVVWVDKNILYFKSSSDYGSKFNTSIILSKNVNLTSSPQLAATEGGNVYVVWVDKKNNSTYGGDTDIAFKWSKDAGQTFKSKKLSRGLSASSLSPQLAATEDGNVYAVWVDKKNNSTYGGDTDIAFKWSKDAGQTFKSKKLSRGLSASSLSPQLAATEDGNVYVVWVDKKNNSTYGGDTDIAFKWSKDAGQTFKSKKLSRGLSASSLSPQLAATEDGNVYVVWVDKKNNSTYGGDTDIAFKWSKDAGQTFKSKKLSRGLSASSLSPQLAATEDGNVYVVWVD